MPDSLQASPSPDALWRNSPAWILLTQAHAGRTLLVLSGGSDETYIVDEATTDEIARRVHDAWHAHDLAALLDDPACGAAARQIQRAGALVPAQALRTSGNYALAWLGTPQPTLSAALDALAADTGLPPRQDDPETADLIVFVRTNASWGDALATYALHPPQVPHLLIDLAYHHTLGIGPYVVPGQTACIACLGNRVAHRWGDLPGPALPETASRPHAAAALLAPLLAAPASLLPYIEHSVSLNLQTLASQRDKVFLLPWCPVCDAARDASPAALALPWLPAATDSSV